MRNLQKIDCTNSELFKDKGFLEWLAKLEAHVAGHCSEGTRWRMYAYEHAAAAYVALDAFTENRESDTTITICLTPNEAEIADVVEGKLDISLPGLVEVMKFVSHLMGGSSTELEVTPWTGSPS